MLKKVALILLALGLLLPVHGVFVAANSTGSLFTETMAGEEFLMSFDDAQQMSEFPGEIPFWVDMVDAEVVENGGAGVNIAVLDSGMLSFAPGLFSHANIRWDLRMGYTHPVTWNGNDFEWGDLTTRDIWTESWASGHGTHVTSTIVGYYYGPYLVRGVAPEATIIPVRVLDYWWLDCPDPNYPGCYNGKVFFRGGTDEMIAAGIMYVADVLTEELDGPMIISMSLGGGSPMPMIEEAINYAINKGIIVVAAAGNSGYAGMGWPAAYPQVISCAMGGWTEQWVGYPDRWWWYDVPEKLNTKDYWGNNWQIFLDYISSRPNKDLGQKAKDLDVCTPGAAIVGPHQPFIRWTGTEWYMAPAAYYYAWGTSMATPHVSAIAAIVLESYPNVNQGTMEFILRKAACGLPLPADGALAYDFPGVLYYFTWYGNDYGAGFLQADAALKFAKNHH